jgi:histidine ammonia-lyase
VLAHPASVDTIPTSGNQEDHVSMGWTAMRKLREVVANVRAVLAVEVLAASQALDFRAQLASPSAAGSAVHARLRRDVPTMDEDRNVSDQIVAVDAMLAELVGAAEAAIGALD